MGSCGSARGEQSSLGIVHLSIPIHALGLTCALLELLASSIAV